MDYARFVGIVACDAVIFIVDVLGGTVRRFCDSRCAFATAEYFNAAMVDCYGLCSFPRNRKAASRWIARLTACCMGWVLRFWFSGACAQFTPIGENAPCKGARRLLSKRISAPSPLTEKGVSLRSVSFRPLAMHPPCC